MDPQPEAQPEALPEVLPEAQPEAKVYKTPAYIRKSAKKYHDKNKNDDLYKQKKRENSKKYYISKKNAEAKEKQEQD